MTGRCFCGNVVFEFNGRSLISKFATAPDVSSRPRLPSPKGIARLIVAACQGGGGPDSWSRRTFRLNLET